MKQSAIAFDQFFNTLTWSKLEGFGMADETLSARMWRLGTLHGQPNWRRAASVVDALFFWDKTWVESEQRWMRHCESSWLFELLRKHLPNGYR